MYVAFCFNLTLSQIGNMHVRNIFHCNIGIDTKTRQEPYYYLIIRKDVFIVLYFYKSTLNSPSYIEATRRRKRARSPAEFYPEMS